MVHGTNALPQAHLINIIRETKDHHPNFVLFLGSGASATSGVPTSSEMIQKWRQQYCEQYSEGCEAADFLKKQPWYDTAEEYSILFEMLYDEPSQRREYIESLLKNASPSWGYIYLVNLLKHDVFNTVLTTNFDDLLNEACYTYSSDVRPIVSAHDSSIRSVRITSQRPKIIKLHGDFLFDSIKNTTRELESLEDNMREKFKQYASEFGFIFVGYAGQDRSVMETLGTLLKQENNFPHGIYWCVREAGKISAGVDRLMRYPRVKRVNIRGFDEFNSDLHEALSLNLQLEMRDPYEALASRLNRLIDEANIPEPQRSHRVIERDIRMLGERIRERQLAPQESQEATLQGTLAGAAATQQKRSLPYKLLAQVEKRLGKLPEARRLILLQLDTKPSKEAFEVAFDLVDKQTNVDDVNALIERLEKNSKIVEQDPGETFNYAVQLMNREFFEQASRVLDIGYRYREADPTYTVAYYWINRAQVHLHLGRAIPEEIRSQVEAIFDITESKLTKMGASIILGQYDLAEQILGEIRASDFKYGVSLKTVLGWPIIKLLPPERIARIIGLLPDAPANGTGRE